MAKGALWKPEEIAWVLAAADVYGTNPQNFQQIQQEHQKFFGYRKADSLHQWYRKELATGKRSGKKAEAERCVKQHGGSQAYLERIAGAHLLVSFASQSPIGSTSHTYGIDAQDQIASVVPPELDVAFSKDDQALALIILQDYSPIFGAPISDFRTWIARLRSLQPKVRDPHTISKVTHLIDMLSYEVENLLGEKVKEDDTFAGMNLLVHAANAVSELTEEDLALLLLLGDGPYRMAEERKRGTVNRLANVIKVSRFERAEDKLSEYCLLLMHTATNGDIQLSYEEPGP